MEYGGEITEFDVLGSAEPVTIYGAGGAGLALLARLREERPDIAVRGFVDTFKSSGSLADLPVRNVDALAPDAGVVLVASIHYRQIAQELRKRGWTRFFVFQDYSGADRSRELRLPLADLHLSGRLKLTSDPAECAVAGRWLLVLNLPVGEAPSMYAARLPKGLIRPECELVAAGLDDPEASRVDSALESGGARRVLLLEMGGDQRQMERLALRLCARPDLDEVVLHRAPGAVKSVVAAERQRLLFLPIPKCGSTTVCYILRSQLEEGFGLGDSPQRARGGDALLCYVDVTAPPYDAWNAFAVVRNPYARLASLYHSRILRGPDAYIFPTVRRHQGGHSFADFCRFAAACPDEVAERHFRSQTRFLTLPDGSLRTDRFLRLEHLTEELGQVLREAGLREVIPRRNRSNREKIDYVERYYDRELLDLVNRRYAEDFRTFGYPML